MNPWLTALVGLGMVSAVLAPFFAWDYLTHRPARARVVRAPAPRRAEPMPLESASPAMPFDSAVVIDRQGASRISATSWEEPR